MRLDLAQEVDFLKEKRFLNFDFFPVCTEAGSGVWVIEPRPRPAIEISSKSWESVNLVIILITFQFVRSRLQ